MVLARHFQIIAAVLFVFTDFFRPRVPRRVAKSLVISCAGALLARMPRVQWHGTHQFGNMPFGTCCFKKRCLKLPQKYGLWSGFRLGVWHTWIQNPNGAPVVYKYSRVMKFDNIHLPPFCVINTK